MVLCDLPYGTTQNNWDSCFRLTGCGPNTTGSRAARLSCTATQPFAAALVMSNPSAFKYEWIGKRNKRIGFQTRRATLPVTRASPRVLPRPTNVHAANVGGFKPSERVERREKGHKQTGAASGLDGRGNGERYPLTVVEFGYDIENKLHRTQKPVLLMEYLIKTYTNPGDTVLDNCMGSGTTGVALRKHGPQLHWH